MLHALILIFAGPLTVLSWLAISYPYCLSVHRPLTAFQRNLLSYGSIFLGVAEYPLVLGHQIATFSGIPKLWLLLIFSWAAFVAWFWRRNSRA